MPTVVRLSASLSLLAAPGSAAADDSLGAHRAAIVNGETSDESEDFVVQVLASVATGNGFACTGTLIAPNVVVTALHCITSRETGQFSCNPDGTLVARNPGDGVLGPLIAPEAVQIFVGSIPGPEPSAYGAKLLGTGSNQICRNDLGIVILDRSLPGAVAKVRLHDPVLRSDVVKVVGYGQTEAVSSVGRHRRGARRVVDVGPDSDSEPLGTAAPRTFVVGEGPCQGDSGGPALSEETGALLGVYSLSAGESCTGTAVRSIYTKLSAFSTLVEQALVEAGAEAQLEYPEQQEVAASEESSGCATARGASAGPPWRWTPLVLVLLSLLLRRASPAASSPGQRQAPG